jgi:hypothetical protein
MEGSDGKEKAEQGQETFVHKDARAEDQGVVK